MPHSRRILILGASGRLGGALVRRLNGRHVVLAPGRDRIDLSQPQRIRDACAALEFDCLINCAALTSPDACQVNAELAWAINAESPGILASLCASRGARMIQISTDYVFAGTGSTPLVESDPTGPLSVYGQTKLAAERAVMENAPAAVVARVSWLFGPDKPAFPDAILQRAMAGEPLSAIDDKWSVPTSTDDLADWLERLCHPHCDLHGAVHLVNAGQATWREFADETVRIAHETGLLDSLPTVQGQPLAGFPGFLAERPRYTVLCTSRFTAATGVEPRPWQAALREYLEKRQERKTSPRAN